MKPKKKQPDYFCKPIAEFAHTEVCRMDRLGPGGASHQYEVFTIPEEGEMGTSLCRIHFQENPVGEAGVNGVQHEDLLAILIDRLRSFQQGKYACDENMRALVLLEDAQAHLMRRTEQGIEGTSQDEQATVVYPKCRKCGRVEPWVEDKGTGKFHCPICDTEAG